MTRSIYLLTALLLTASPLASLAKNPDSPSKVLGYCFVQGPTPHDTMQFSLVRMGPNGFLREGTYIRMQRPFVAERTSLFFVSATHSASFDELAARMQARKDAIRRGEPSVPVSLDNIHIEAAGVDLDTLANGRGTDQLALTNSRFQLGYSDLDGNHFDPYLNREMGNCF